MDARKASLPHGIVIQALSLGSDIQNDWGHAMKRNAVVLALVGLCAALMVLCACSSTQQSSSSSAPTSASSASSAPASQVSAPAPSTCGALKVSGTQLMDSKGNPVQLKGVSTHGLSWFGQYVNEECFATLKNDWKCSVVRLALYTAESGGYCTDGDKAKLRELVDSGVRYATNQDLYVIIDWHILSDNNPNMHVAEAKEFFADVSARYAGQNNVIYEICNEPNGDTSWADVKAYANEIIPVIRANDKDAIILVGTPNYAQYVDEAAADPITGFDNIMYTLHFYAATHKDDLRSRLTQALDAGLPVFVSEFSICDASGSGSIDASSARAWIDLLDQRGISYVAWSLTNKDETSALLRPDCTKTSGFTVDDLSVTGTWIYDVLTQTEAGSPAGVVKGSSSSKSLS